MEKNAFQLVVILSEKGIVIRAVMTKEKKYILIIGSLLLFVALIYRYSFFGVEFFSENQELELKQKKILKYEAAVQQKKYIEKYLVKLNRASAESEKIFLKGTTPALGAVDIQNTLNTIAQKVGINIQRIDIRKTKSLKGKNMISIPVRFTMNSTTRQLRDMIFYIENSKKLLRIINLTSNVRRVRHPERVDSSVTVEGFIRE